MVTTVVLSVVCLGVLGVGFGAGLALASRRFHVDTDPRVDEIIEALPGANCGACGYAGCAAFAEAVVKGEALADACVVGGVPCAKAVAAIMGADLGEAPVRKRAVVHCQGGTAEAVAAFEYGGVSDCRAAALIQGGPKLCKFGCLGFGTCALVCPFGAITMGENGLPAVSEEKCTACGICVKACPVGIISLVPCTERVFFACSNPVAKAKEMKQTCSRGCIKCRLCVKVTKSGAITWGGDLPQIDSAKWDDPDLAIEKCPMGCFADERESVPEPAGATA